MIKKHRLTTLLLTFLLASSAGAADAFEATDLAIKKGNFAEARTQLDAALAKDAGNFHAVWRLSRLQVMEADAKSDPAEKEKGYAQALATADRAVEIAPNEPHGYLRRASAAGKLALFKGVLEAREKVLMVKENAEKAIAIASGGPDVQGWAHYVLGRAHLKLSETPAVIRKPLGLAWGSVAGAEKHLLQAVELKPESVLIWAEVAKLRRKQKKKSEFDQAMGKVRALPILEPTDKDGKTEAQSLSFD